MQIRTDRALLRRVLGNLLKNALEAVQPGDQVRMDAVPTVQGVAYHVYNPGFIAPEIQMQIFQRSFSTKGEAGRGIGTHSVKLLTESYLGGKVSFVSTEEEGTTFTVTLPLDLRAAQEQSEAEKS
jgi:hypothetical protein